MKKYLSLIALLVISNTKIYSSATLPIPQEAALLAQLEADYDIYQKTLGLLPPELRDKVNLWNMVSGEGLTDQEKNVVTVAYGSILKLFFSNPENHQPNLPKLSITDAAMKTKILVELPEDLREKFKISDNSMSNLSNDKQEIIKNRAAEIIFKLLIQAAKTPGNHLIINDEQPE